MLLIIFMVAAPLATGDIAVDLPSSNAEPQQKPDKPIYLTLKPDLTLAIGDSPIARDQLASALDSATSGNKDDRIFLRADRSVPYGDVTAVMNELRAARYLKMLGRPRDTASEMSMSALTWHDDRNPRQLARWAVAGAVVLGVHAGAPDVPPSRAGARHRRQQHGCGDGRVDADRLGRRTPWNKMWPRLPRPWSS